MTVAEYLNRWLASLAGTVRPNTALSYSSTIRLYINPHLGDRALALLSTGAVREMFAKLAEDGKSPRVRELVYHVLKSALRAATEDGLIVATPMTATIRPPKVDRPPVTALDPDGVRAFLKVAREDELAALWELAIATGMRQGELLGLHWDEVDLERGKVYVRATLIEQNGHILGRAAPKSKNGTRTLSIPPRVVRSLEALKARNLDPVIVFAQEPGKYRLKTSIMRRFKRLLKRAGLPEMKFHSLRHTTASNLAAAGHSAKVVQRVLGHFSASFTLDQYVHLFDGDGEEAAGTMGEVMG